MTASQSHMYHDLTPGDEDYQELNQLKYCLLQLENPLDDKILKILEKLSEKHQDHTKKIAHLYIRVVSYSGVDWLTIKDGLISYVTRGYWALHAALQMTLSTFQISMSRDFLKTTSNSSSRSVKQTNVFDPRSFKQETTQSTVSSNSSTSETQDGPRMNISLVKRGSFKSYWAHVDVKDDEGIVIRPVKPQALGLSSLQQLTCSTRVILLLLNLDLEKLSKFLIEEPDFVDRYNIILKFDTFERLQLLNYVLTKVPDGKEQWIEIPNTSIQPVTNGGGREQDSILL